MPELPDISVCCERLTALLTGERLRNLRIGSPFLLRTTEPSADAFVGRRLEQATRLGKRIAPRFEGAQPGDSPQSLDACASARVAQRSRAR